MINLQKVDNKSKVSQPGIMMFASPAITPSNNYKPSNNLQREAAGMNHSSQIQGRKCDSPQLRVMRDQMEGGSRPQTASNSIHIPSQLKKDDFLQLYNYHNQIRDLNHTNKEIQKKQFDFNINKQKANVTIQYDNENIQNNKQNNRHQQQQQQAALNNTHIENSRTHKSSKSIGGVNQKRRQQSQSMPRHQPSASIVNSSQAQQPLINLHVQNTKALNNSQVNNSKVKSKRGVVSNSQIPQKQQYNSSSGQQSAPNKSRSKSKNRQKSTIPTNYVINQHVHNYNSQLPPGTQQRAAFMAQATKEILNQSKVNKNSFMFSFDNKENESVNYNEFSPSRIIGKHPQNANAKINNFLDSDSSDDETKRHGEQQIAQKLEKQYFLDKSTLLKHLSPERNQNSKTRVNKSGMLNHSIIPQQILSDRDNKYNPNYLSNGSTIIHPGFNDSAINKTANQSLVNIKFKRGGNPTTTTHNNGVIPNNKIIMKGVDKLIKENLRRNKTKEEEEISKKYLEEFKQKLKKNELTQRNQQVRKINASKIMYNHQHKNSQALGRVNLHKVGYKKQRSKSCMNKTDNIFGQGLGPRSKERLPASKINEQQLIVPQPPTNFVEMKKEKKREKSFVLEIRDLQKQIDGEIRREIMQGKIDIQPSSAANKKTNLSTINAKKDYYNIPVRQQQNKKDMMNMSAIDNNNYHNKKSSEELMGDNHFIVKRKSKSKDKNKSISQNIKKFMEKKKNAQQQLKSLEQTIENKKHQKIKENLKSLHQFAKQNHQHIRHQSYNFYPKKKNDFNFGPLTNILQQNESGKALPVKKLKPQFFNNKNKKKKSTERLQGKKNFDFRGDGETIFDDDIQDRSITPLDNDDRYEPSGYNNQNNNGDVSREFLDDYQKILKSIQKHQKHNLRDSSNSNDRSNSNKRTSSAKNNKNRKSYHQQQPKSQLQKELEVSAFNDRKAKLKSDNHNNQTISIDNQSRFNSIKNESNNNAYVPSVVQEKNASLIPPQSEIATIDRNHLDRSQNIVQRDHNNNKRHSDVRRSHDSNNNGRSPKHSEQKAKVQALMNRYGHNLPQTQLAAKSADTKLLIKLHSAAITIQQNYRRHLQSREFYENESSDPQSQMYVDSDEDQNNEYPQYIETTEKKQQAYQKELLANSSPLRVKAKYQQQYNNNTNQLQQHIQHKLQPQLLPQQKGNKFYSEDSSDIEKVVVCSVITSGRADGEESLSNTLKYVPLRQKIQLPTGKVPPQQNQQQQQQVIPSSTSSAQQSQLNTVIKTQPALSLHQRLKLDQQQLQPQQLPSDQQSIDYSQQSSSSQRKKLVPSLDFGKLTTIQQKEEQKQQNKEEVIPKILKPISTSNHYQDEEQKHHDQGSNTARSVFERNTFQDFQLKHKEDGFNMNNYPEMIKMREEAIKYREQEEQKQLQKMVKNKQMSPRTYDIKCRELETWVSKEKEEVKKTRHVFEEQWQKTAQIIEQTQKNQDNMKKLLKDNNNYNNTAAHHQHPTQLYNQMAQLTNKTHESLPSENTLGAPIISHRLSSRREDSTRLLDMIDDYKQEQPYYEINQAYQIEQAKKQKEQQDMQQRIQKDQERLQIELERKKEIEQLKEQERQRELERQKRIQEEEKKRKEELDRIREAEKQKLIQLEKERMLKKEEEERQRKAKEAEDKRQKELEIKKKQEQEELKKKQLEEEKKRKQQEDERIEAERQRKVKEQQVEEERLKKQKEEENRLKKIRDEQEKQRLQKLKEEEDERIRKENEQKQQQKLAAEQEKQKKQEQERKEREEQLLKKQQEEKLKQQQKEKEEKEKKEKEDRQKKIEQERLQREQEEQQRVLKEQQNELIRQQQQNEPYVQKQSDYYEDDFLNSDDDASIKQIEDAFLSNVVNQRRGKEILESQPDDFDLNNISEIKPHHTNAALNQYFNEDSPQSSSSKSRQNQLPSGQLGKYDDSRQLQRTTSSQNLDHKSIEAYQQYNNPADGDDNGSDENNNLEGDDEEVKDKFSLNNTMNNNTQFRLDSSPDNLQQQHPSITKLNDDSFDEEKLNTELLERQEKQNQIVGDIIKKDNFFSLGFDDSKPEELMSSIQRTLDETKNIDLTQESKLTHPTIDKIVVHDESEYDIKTQEFIEPIFNNTRLTHQMRSQIPVEQEESNPHGLPVSPISAGGNDIRITTGAQSLESTISDGEQIKNAIIEANRNSLEMQQQPAPQADLQANDIDTQADSITDDIFRQLMAEMKVDLDLLLLTDPRRLLREETTNQNQFLSESGRFLIFERRGIKTDLFAIERYVEEVLDEILRDQSRFQTSIQQAISKNAREVLNQLQNSEIGSYEHFEPNYPVVLPLDLYLRLERRRKENREKELQDETRDQSLTQQQVQDRNFLAECEHIHNKVLFDCINDSLLQFKPYGKDGMPLPWSRQNRRLKPIEEFTIEEMFEIVKHDLFRWAIMQAGTLPRREFVFNNLFDDELFAEIREKKLATLLAREMIENEPKWLNYEFEEAQVKIDIGDMILEQLVTETITILKKNEALSINALVDVLI